MACDWCHGTGRLPDGRQCTPCSANGMVIADDDEREVRTRHDRKPPIKREAPKKSA